MPRRGLSFALPPSLGSQSVRTLAREFAHVLYEVGFETVIPIKSYEAIERALLSGDIDAAWGPPMVCARVEAAGGIVALQGVRQGATTYRSVLLCRAHDDLSLSEIGQPGLRRLRACWVDRWSMGGYIMPRHHLITQHIDLEQAFIEEQLLGSYDACFDAVLNGDADITASYASARGLGYVELCGSEAYQLRTLAYTEECPNDGVVISPTAVESAQAIFDRFDTLLDSTSKRQTLARALAVDDFEAPAARAYSDLLSLLHE